MATLDHVLYCGTKFTNQPIDPSKRWILCSYYFSFKWSTLYQGDKDTNDIYSKDNSNYFKLIEDAIFEYMEINDKYVSTIAGSKILSRDVFGVDRNLIILIIENKSNLLHPGDEFYRLVTPVLEAVTDSERKLK